MYRVDSTGSKFLAPVDGWSEYVFSVISSTPRNTDPSAKRKKMMDPSGDEESAGEEAESTAKQQRLLEPEQRRCSDLIILGLPYRTTSAQLKAYFEQFGRVVVSEVKMESEGKSKGFGFVQFADYDSQLKVLSRQTHQIDGRNCQVKIPNSKAESSPQICPKVFVGRVTSRHTTETLREFFQERAHEIDPQSSVVDVFIPRPFRAFAFVTFSHSHVSQEIIRTGDFVIEGASVSVSAASPKENNSTRPLPVNSYHHSGTRSYGGRNNRGTMDSYGYDASRHSDVQNVWTEGGGPLRGDSRMMPNPNHRYSPVNLPPRAMTRPPIPQPPGYPGTSNALASGMDALNLNQMNPDLVNAAWKAFWNTLQSQQHGGGQSSGQQPQSHW